MAVCSSTLGHSVLTHCVWLDSRAPKRFGRYSRNSPRKAAAVPAALAIASTRFHRRGRWLWLGLLIGAGLMIRTPRRWQINPGFDSTTTHLQHSSSSSAVL